LWDWSTQWHAVRVAMEIRDPLDTLCQVEQWPMRRWKRRAALR
jgi:hypothetical protein